MVFGKMIYPTNLNKVINFYKKLPGIGAKTAERLAIASINIDRTELEGMAANLLALKSLKKCEICGHLTDENICSICNNEKRNQNLICVVEDYKSVFTFEKAGNYNGVFHVLGGLISPIEGRGPEDLNIDSLIKRVAKLDHPELIVALKSTIEGETTILYLKKRLEGQKVKISRLSYGIPIGAEIEYLDCLTLDKALADRREI